MGEKTITDLQRAIEERRSVKGGYIEEPVPEKLVLDLLDSASWAPTHGVREPWRFIFVGTDDLPDFAKKIANTYEEKLIQNRQNYLNEPRAILVAIMKAPEMQKQWDENFGAIASLIQNFSLLAWEKKLGVCWKTNPHIYNEDVRKILNVKDTEKIVGFIHLGYFDEQPEAKERTAIKEKYTNFKDM